MNAEMEAVRPWLSTFWHMEEEMFLSRPEKVVKDPRMVHMKAKV